MKEMNMISTMSKLALALGIIGAISLSIPSAEARTKQTNAKASQSIVIGAPQTLRRSYNYAPSLRRGVSGRYNNQMIRGTNYNPNQGAG
jgi:hypothetical protein